MITSHKKMKIKRKFGIREKLIVPLVAGLTLVIFILIFFLQPAQLKKVKQDFVYNQTNILKTLVPGVNNLLWQNDYAALYDMFETARKIHQQEWKALILTNPQGKQLYPLTKTKVEEKGTVLKIEIPLQDKNESYGKLTLYTDWARTRQQEQQNIYQLSLYTVIIILLVGITGYILMTRWIYSPISQLKEITGQFAKGNYKSTINIRNRDEIAELAQSIDHMRDRILLQINKITDKEKMQRAILESVGDGIITIDQQGIVHTFNPGAENIFGYRAEEVIGKNIRMLQPGEIAKHHDEYLAKYDITTPVKTYGIDGTLSGKRKGGELFPIEITISGKIIEGKYLFTGIIRDITERRKLDKLKDEFISTVSHELRTPLTAIMGSLELISKGMGLELPEQVNTMLDVAVRNVHRLLTLINDILDISKLESGEMTFSYEEIEICSFIQDAIDLNQEYAKKYSTRFECIDCDENIYINADRDRLSQVMSNLLSNAAKYSPENIPVEITAQKIDDHIRISIRDHGPGIPEEFQPVVFDKFTQSSSGDTRQVGGTGLGLNITKMIVEKMGGQIDFSTIVGKETTFFFELPVIDKND